MTLTRNDSTYGCDIGIVTFVDQWLHFEGLRTTFSLPSTAERRLEDLEVSFYAPGGQRRVVFFPRPFEKTFLVQALKSWYSHTPSDDPSAPFPPIVDDGRSALFASLPQIRLLTAVAIFGFAVSPWEANRYILFPLYLILLVLIFRKVLYASIELRSLRRALRNDRESQDPNLQRPSLNQALSTSPGRMARSENVVDQQDPPPPNEIHLGGKGSD